MGVRARWLRLALGTSVAGLALALAGCGAAALPPPPPAAATVPAVAAATSTRGTPTAGKPTEAPAAGGGDVAQLAAGKTAFSSAGCGGCHMLTAAGAAGQAGPSLNGIGSLHDASWIVMQIQNPCATGHANAGGAKYNCAAMPPNLASGAQAEAIAAYLAAQK
jgi:cytochrome c551/c552